MSDAATTPTFARLADVPPREAWAHEAHVFTPWLADNLDRLAEAIGIPLELTGREVGVGRYSADILATCPQDGSIVLIENQLEWSDHTHMGQILTYLAGLEAQVVVWLAPQFREEHLSALRWLNQHTDERFSFFAVRLRVVQIADSPLAPLFDVLEKPNSWDRSLQKTARAVSAAPADPDRKAALDAFWAEFEARDPLTAQDRRIAGNTVRWRAIPNTGFVISRYRSKGHVGLFLRASRGPEGEGPLLRLEAAGSAMEQALGVPFGKADYPFSQDRLTDHADPASVSAAIDWLIAETDRYVAAATEYLQMDPA